MSQRFLLRLGAAAGLLAAVLTTAGFSLLLSHGVMLAEPPTAEAVARLLAVPEHGMITLGRFLHVLGVLFLLVFSARVWLSLRLAEGEPGWIALLVFGAGLGLMSVEICALAALHTLGFGAALSVEGAMAIIYLNRAFYMLSWALIALFLGATALLVLSTGVLPRWLGWSAALLALANLASIALPLAELAQLPPLIFRLWLIACSIVLLRRAEEPGLRAAQTPAAAPSSF